MVEKMKTKTIEKMKEILEEKEVVLTKILEITQSGDLSTSIIEEKEELISKVYNYDQNFLEIYDLEQLEKLENPEEIKEIQHRVKHMMFLTKEIEKNEAYNYNRNNKKMKHTKEKLRNVKPGKKMVNLYKEQEMKNKNRN